MVPFAGFNSFTDKMISKGKDSESADKICGKLQSETKGAAAHDCISEAMSNGMSVEEAHEKCIDDGDHNPADLKYGDPGSEFNDQYVGTTGTRAGAIDYDECIDQVTNEYGMDDDSAKRVCNSVTINDDDEKKDASMDDNSNDKNYGSSSADGWYNTQSAAADNKMIENCVKAKQKANSNLSDLDAQKQCEKSFAAFNSGSLEEADLKMQNQYTDPGKLDNYLSTEAIDWNSDAAADYNEKSDTKKIDLSYYDDDINKCVDAQVKNGLSQENARMFCQNLANYNGDSDITPDDQLLPVKYENREYVTGSDTGSHVAQVTTTNDTSAADVANSPTIGKKKKKNMSADTYLQDKGYPKHIETSTDPDMSTDPKTLGDFSGGPSFDHIVPDRADGDGHSGGDGENDLEDDPDYIKFDHNSSLDDNDHVNDATFLEDMDKFLADIEEELDEGYEDDGQAMNAYYSPEQTSLVENDPLEGGDDDAPQIGSPVVTGHGQNNIEDEPHTHDLGADGPRYDHFGDRVVDEADNSAPDQYELDNSSIDDNDFIDTHMFPAQAQMGEQNTERIPSMEDNESMAGLGYNSTPGSIKMKNGPGSAFNNGINEPAVMTALPESPTSAPVGASLNEGESLMVSSAAFTAPKGGIPAGGPDNPTGSKFPMISGGAKYDGGVLLSHPDDPGRTTQYDFYKGPGNQKTALRTDTKYGNQWPLNVGHTAANREIEHAKSNGATIHADTRGTGKGPSGGGDPHWVTINGNHVFIGSLQPPNTKSGSVQWTKSGSQTYSAQQCEQDFGGDQDAKDICGYIAKNYQGSYDKYIEDMRIEPFVSNNKLFVKAFLMDPSLNMNQWGVHPSTLDANIRSYIGKPLVLQENFDHPVSADDNLQHQLEYQELFRVGTISDVVKKGGKYEAIAEITDPYAQKAFREGNLPLYVSPQLYKLDASEPDGQMTKWTGTHLAIVKDPAYGIKLATVSGQCTGEHDTCMSYLKKAAIIRDNGYGSCGYCNYKVLTSARSAATDDGGKADDAKDEKKKKKKVEQQDDDTVGKENIENNMSAKSLEARIEEDKQFIANMERFIANLKDDLRLARGETN
jgi:hypothetical protein